VGIAEAEAEAEGLVLESPRRGAALVGIVLAVLGACTGARTDVGSADRARPRNLERASCRGTDVLAELTRRGYFAGRSPDILVIPDAPNFIGLATNPPHTGPWRFLVNVPLVLYGPGAIARRGRVDTPAEMTDLAPTAARLIGYGSWPRRDGRVLEESLVGDPQLPRVVVTVVWDGGGWNTLREHPGAWPFLRSLMRSGVTYTRFSIGSSPSVTPPVHATIGTGAYPARHGIVGVSQRVSRERLVDPWAGYESTLLRIPTLADLYDRSRDNRPLTAMLGSVNWHLGMIGHGASARGGDRDPVVLLDHFGNAHGNTVDYLAPQVATPELLGHLEQRLDARDGRRDDRWRDGSLDDPSNVVASPAFARYQGVALRRMIDALDLGADGVPDLLYVNFKQSDLSYHKWGIRSLQVRDALEEQDRELRKLVDHLNARVGKRRWALMLTADHGLMPTPADSGGYPIKGQELLDDINARFDSSDNGKPLAYHATAYGIYVDPEERASGGARLDAIARWLSGYSLRENAQAVAALSGRYRGRGSERLFDVVMVGRRRVDDCAGHS
jgi:hypothetical protein